MGVGCVGVGIRVCAVIPTEIICCWDTSSKGTFCSRHVLATDEFLSLPFLAWELVLPAYSFP